MNQGERASSLLARFAEHALEALLITHAADVFYLSGFRGSSGSLLLSADRRIVVTDFRYRTQVAEQAPDWLPVETATGRSQVETTAELIREHGWRRVGFQADQVTFHQWEKLREGCTEAVTLTPTTGWVAEQRQVKDAGELARIRHAAAVADEAMRFAAELLRPGLSEREAKAELEHHLVRSGAERPSFETIVASGPNGAMPHAPVSDRRLATGDLVTIDLGAVVDGYCSDLTRTFAVGDCSAELTAIHELVFAAQAAGLAAVRAGATGREVDQAAREVIQQAGRGDQFGHALGHGVGIEIHEGPRLAATVEQPLVAGQVVTVEPGVYVHGLGGVRIEDLVQVTDDGCVVLSHAAKSPRPLAVGE